MLKLPILKAGDKVELIAPASRCTESQLTGLKSLLNSWQLQCLVDDDIFGDDLLCANNDNARLNFLQSALENRESKAIICARGGYGSMRLLPNLKRNTLMPPKLFVGMSDITALNLYLQQHWCWPTIHGALAVDKFSKDSIIALKSMLFAEETRIKFYGHPLNKAAQKNQVLESTITGGNLSIVQTSIGTSWQINAAGKMIFLEEVGERAYRIDRMLEHLRQAEIFDKVVAILFGDFIGGLEANGTSLVQPVLQRFAGTFPRPVIKIDGIGHGHINFPLPLGTKAELQLGPSPSLTCFR